MFPCVAVVFTLTMSVLSADITDASGAIIFFFFRPSWSIIWLIDHSISFLRIHRR